jgi:protein required for attachment to host cells
MRRRWILIGDGSRAKIIEKFRGEFKPIHLTFHAEKETDVKDKGHHAPGAVSPSVVHAKHSFPPHQEWSTFQTHTFVKQIADILNHGHDRFDELLLIVPSKILGELRPHLNENARIKVIGEIHKDYTHTPLHEIEHLF